LRFSLLTTFAYDFDVQKVLLMIIISGADVSIEALFLSYNSRIG
tara:strand:+ start:746 stop:877 length:132 start_codon:yes stop_codon:yes gene_type:complete